METSPWPMVDRSPPLIVGPSRPTPLTQRVKTVRNKTERRTENLAVEVINMGSDHGSAAVTAWGQLRGELLTKTLQGRAPSHSIFLVFCIFGCVEDSILYHAG